MRACFYDHVAQVGLTASNLVKKHVLSADLEESFFVGDAAGRDGDHSDSDK